MKLNISKTCIIIFTTLCNAMQESDKPQITITLKTNTRQQLRQLEIDQEGTFAHIITKYRNEKCSGDNGVNIKLIVAGKAVDPEAQYNYEKDLKPFGTPFIFATKDWLIRPKGTLLSNKTHFSITINEEARIHDLMDKIHLKITQEKLADNSYYMITIIKDEKSLNTTDIIQCAENLSNYEIKIDKSLLTLYKSSSPNQTITYKLDYPPFWEILCMDDTKALRGRILLPQVLLDIIKKDETLEIIFNSPANQIHKSVIISDASKLKIYKNFSFIFNEEYDGKSDFNNPSTKNFYEFGREALALWIHENTKQLQEKFGINSGSCELWAQDNVVNIEKQKTQSSLPSSPVEKAKPSTWKSWLYNGWHASKARLYSAIAYFYPRRILTNMWSLPSYIKNTAVYRTLFTGQSQQKPQPAQ